MTQQELISPRTLIGGPGEDEEFVMNPTQIGTGVANEVWAVAAVVIYDEPESGSRAKAFLDQVAANAGGGMQFSLALWQMDWLAFPFTANEVFRALERSNVLVLALRAGGELAKSVLDWVACWAQRRVGGDSALVILGDAHTTAVEALRQIAERYGIRLFSQQTTLPNAEWQHYLQGPQNPEQILGPKLGEIPHHPRSESYRDWGINE